MKTRITLVGDHTLTLIGVRYLLDAYDDLRTVAQAQDAGGLLAQLEAHPCDLLITDLMMPGNQQADGSRLVRKVRRHYPDLPIIVVIMLGSPALVSSLLKLGIHGLVSKRDMLDDLPKAIRHISRWPFISSSIAHLLEVNEAEHGRPLASLEQLTPHEVKVPHLYGSGPAVGEITIQLCCSKQTISTRKGSATRKLGLDSNAELFIYIRGNGLIRAARPRHVRPANPLHKIHAATRTSRSAGRRPCPPPLKDSFHIDRSRRLSTQLYLLLLGLASQVEAHKPQPCASRLLGTVARQVGHDGWIAPSYESPGPFLAVACKPWPDGPAQTVITMAYPDPGDTTVEGERCPHLLLAKADSRSSRPLERYDSGLEEDASVAVGSDSLWLDTACYRLSPTVRTFDMMFHSVARGASCPEASLNNLLTLVMPAGDSKLRSVLNTYLDQWRALKGSICSVEPRFEQGVSRLTLELSRGRSNGFADLVITSQVSSDETGNGKPLHTVKHTLRYSGEHYPFEKYSDL